MDVEIPAAVARPQRALVTVQLDLFLPLERSRLSMNWRSPPSNCRRSPNWQRRRHWLNCSN
jgi:hypothetical protein